MSMHIHPATTSTAERIMVPVGLKQEALVRVEESDDGYSYTPLRWNGRHGRWHETFTDTRYMKAVGAAERRME